MRTHFQPHRNSGIPLVIYESGNRIEQLSTLLESSAPGREIVVFRELTKLHEQAIRSTAALLPGLLANATIKGEFVVVVGPGAESEEIDLDQLILRELERGRKGTDIARDLARTANLPRSEVYDRILVLAKIDQGA